MRTIKVLVVLHKGVLLHGSEPSIGRNDGDMDTHNQGEGRTNESNDDRVVKGAEKKEIFVCNSKNVSIYNCLKYYV